MNLDLYHHTHIPNTPLIKRPDFFNDGAIHDGNIRPYHNSPAIKTDITKSPVHNLTPSTPIEYRRSNEHETPRSSLLTLQSNASHNYGPTIDDNIRARDWARNLILKNCTNAANIHHHGCGGKMNYIKLAEEAVQALTEMPINPTDLNIYVNALYEEVYKLLNHNEEGYTIEQALIGMPANGLMEYMKLFHATVTAEIQKQHVGELQGLGLNHDQMYFLEDLSNLENPDTKGDIANIEQLKQMRGIFGPIVQAMLKTYSPEQQADFKNYTNAEMAKAIRDHISVFGQDTRHLQHSHLETQALHAIAQEDGNATLKRRILPEITNRAHEIWTSYYQPYVDLGKQMLGEWNNLSKSLAESYGKSPTATA